MEILLPRDDMGEPWIAETETVNPPTVTERGKGTEMGKGTSLNSASLAPKPVASSVYVRVPEAPCPHKRSILVTSLFPFFSPPQQATQERAMGASELTPRSAPANECLPEREVAALLGAIQ